MATKIQSRGRIEGGKLIIYNRPMLNDLISKKKDCEVMVTIDRVGKRSNQANAYMWGVVIPIVCDRLKDLGHDVNAELTHEILKLKFNVKYVHDENGEVIGEFGGTTTNLSTTDFMIYIEAIQRWASSTLGIYIEAIQRWASSTLGIYIPDPNEQTEMFKDDEPEHNS